MIRAIRKRIPSVSEELAKVIKYIEKRRIGSQSAAELKAAISQANQP